MTRGIFPKIALFALIALFGVTEVAMAQPGGRGGRGGGAPGGFGGNSALGLLANEQVQEELELVGDQVEALEQLQSEQRSAFQELFSGFRDRFRDMEQSERESVMGEIREKIAESNKEFEERANEELLPHQISRLKQLMFQSTARRGGGITGGQMSENLVEDLGITDDQLEKMKEKAESVRADLAEKMAKLRSQAEEEILSVLDSGQREKYRELTGDPFEFSQGNQFGGGGQGGRGDRGGDRGGRGGDRGDRGGRGGDRPSGERDDQESDSDF